MTTDGSILGGLPEYVPTSLTTFTDELEIVTDPNSDTGDTKRTYTVRKSPFERIRRVSAVVNQVEQELTVGDDVIAVDTNNDGDVDAVEFSGVTPDVGTTAIVEYNAVPIIKRYVDTFDDDVEYVGELQDEAQVSRAIENASGTRLDLIGAQFGEIGRRLGRDDGEYSSYLLSVVNAFNATGTKSDIRFVAAGALGVDPDNITITEDTVRVGFNISVDASGALFAQSLNELLDQASAAGVELLNPPVIQISTGDITVGAQESSVTERASGLGSGTLE